MADKKLDVNNIVKLYSDSLFEIRGKISVH